MGEPTTTRRTFLASSAGALAASGLLPASALGTSRHRARAWARPDLSPRSDMDEALRVLGRRSLRLPDSLPHASLPAGTDVLPKIEHVVVVMMENHSYDNVFGMLGQGSFELPRGDGYTLAADGYPANSNPQANGRRLRAFHMPTTCQLSGKPSQDWAASHIQYDGGKNDGFVISASGPVAMGYWTGVDLPFTYDLAKQFPIGDRYFSSVLGQTDPNRRYLIAATSSGMTDDIGSSVNNMSQNALLTAVPKNGTIFSRLSDANVSWLEYAVESTSFVGATENLYPAVDSAYNATHVKPYTQFLTDAAAGTLPSVSLIDPNFATQSQENPQNIVIGEAFLETVVNAIGSSPNWEQTVLIINYDEHGGYYDHVPPPAALAPDGVAPVVEPGENVYDGFHRYGFRVPAVVVGPYVKPGYVSHKVYDHTSVLAFIEHKWNLPAMTYRDANANNMLDFLDLPAMSASLPTFPTLPKLAAAGDTAKTLMCSTTGPGRIPPSRAPAALAYEVKLTYAGVSQILHGLVVELKASRAGRRHVVVELMQGRKRVVTYPVSNLSPVSQQIVLRERGRVPKRGRYTIVVTEGRKTLARQAVRVG